MTRSLIRPLFGLFFVLTVLTGIVYPLAVTGIGQWLFAQQAHGSLIFRQGQPVGSALMGQSFSDPAHFWARPSATTPMPYNAGASTGSNWGPLNPALVDAVQARVQALRASDPGNTAPVPVDLVTASASGLDPDISLAAAQWQVARVARARGLAPQRVAQLVDSLARSRSLGFLGEPTVNVLRLNLALDAMR